MKNLVLVICAIFWLTGCATSNPATQVFTSVSTPIFITEKIEGNKVEIKTAKQESNFTQILAVVLANSGYSVVSQDADIKIYANSNYIRAHVKKVPSFSARFGFGRYFGPFWYYDDFEDPFYYDYVYSYDAQMSVLIWLKNGAKYATNLDMQTAQSWGALPRHRILEIFDEEAAHKILEILNSARVWDYTENVKK